MVQAQKLRYVLAQDKIFLVFCFFFFFFIFNGVGSCK